MKVRTQDKWGRHGRRRATHCEAAGCSQPTREGKPYCSKHVEEHPYVQELLGKLADKAAEEGRVQRQGSRAVDVDGLTAQEILLFLKVHGGRTVQRLSRELNIDCKTLEGYVSALRRRKLVKTSPTRRGGSIVRLPGQPLPESAKRREARQKAKKKAKSEDENNSQAA